MRQYHDLVESVLTTGTYKENRTAVDTISGFSAHYKIDLQEGFPLLTTKQMDGYRWNSLIHELLWYLSGEEHIKNLREETKIWDAWADDDGLLDTAYGRFWRRYPIPDGADALNGETWASVTDTKWDDNPDIDPSRWVNEENTRDDVPTRRTFDQLQYVIDMLNENPNSRRLIVNAWHPANATVSTLPPCHYTFVFNVQDGKLNTHLTQRSGDIALGVPFNIAAYSILTHVIANQTPFEPGTFSHTVVDAHIYCGKGERGQWYGENLHDLREQLQMAAASPETTYSDVADWLEAEAPDEGDEADGYDHVPNLLRQLDREPLDRPTLSVADKPLDELEYDDIELRDYESYGGLDFSVAE